MSKLSSGLEDVCTCPKGCDCAQLDMGGFVSEFCVIHNRNPIPWVDCTAPIHHWDRRYQ